MLAQQSSEPRSPLQLRSHRNSRRRSMCEVAKWRGQKENHSLDSGCICGRRTGLTTEPKADAFSASLISLSGKVLINWSNGKRPSTHSRSKRGMNSCGSTSPSKMLFTVLPINAFMSIFNSPGKATETKPTLPPKRVHRKALSMTSGTPVVSMAYCKPLLPDTAFNCLSNSSRPTLQRARRAQAEREAEAALVHVHCDDGRRPRHLGGHHRCQAHSPCTEDCNALTRLYIQCHQHRTSARLNAAAQWAQHLQGQALIDHHGVALCGDGMPGEC
mmetsp:Transcript_14448/g.38407  ORF Transcript_14448/g.38407 Transcript_14448/m.38407 type:complete len:273 (+) Transcript_14448:276-1094(+)